LEIIEDLKSDLRTRDQEFEQMRLRVERLEQSNTYLAKQLLEEKRSKQTIEAKMNKLRYLKELDENFAKISNGTFFDGKKPNAHSLRQNLLDSVND
jgi:UDP-N-acetylenolpyruvoylglucosamine reductase